MKNVLFILLMVLASNVNAAMITLGAIDSGRYGTDVYGFYNDNNITAGYEISSGITWRNWLKFDLSGIPTEYLTSVDLSAELEIFNHSSNDSGLTFTWSDVTTSIPGIPPLIYNDLGTGTVYGSGTTSAGSNDIYALTNDAITSIKSTPGTWAMGGSTALDTGLAYGFSGGVASGTTINLNLTIPDPIVVPAPAAFWLFGSGLLSLVGLVRRKRVV